MVPYEVQLAYDEYCVDCQAEGISPLPFCAWEIEEFTPVKANNAT